MLKSLLVAGAALALTTHSYAVETKFWVQNERAHFEEGKLNALSLRSDGRLTLGPRFKEIFDSATPYLWALAADSKGNLYAGGGGPSQSTTKLFLREATGKSRVLAELPGMEIHAIAVDAQDQVFAATSPDGQVYRIDRGGKATPFYDPKAKYIWAMAFNGRGDLFIATGDQGEIHRVTPDGKGSVFFRTEETHARSLAIDSDDNVIAGTEPGGLVLRISPAGEGFVVYQAPKREITAIAVAKDGTIYAAGVGTKSELLSPAERPALTLTAPPAPGPSAGSRGPGSATVTVQAAKISPPPPPARPTDVSGGSELYRIESDNYPRKIWSHAQDIVYAIAFDAQARPVIGTGNRGNIYRLESDRNSTLIINALPTQVTALASGAKAGLYAATANIGKIYEIGPEVERRGTFESDPLDVVAFSLWGRLAWRGEARGGRVLFETRSGNLDRPQKNWSPWSAVDDKTGSRVTSPAARFLQYRVTLEAAPGGESPELTEVEIAYMPKNAAPVMEQIEATPANYRFVQPSLSLSPVSSQNVTLPPIGQKQRQSGPAISLEPSQTMQYAKGWVGARWSASDPNGDELQFRVEIKGVLESQWKLLKEKVKEKYLSWDSTAYPDGEYQIRITASDAPDNPPQHALTGSLEGERFLIDNTPPQVASLSGLRSGATITIRWSAKDALTVIDKAEYSLNGGDWVVVEPTTMLTDSLHHEYVLSIPNAAPGEQTIAVRVSDEFDNQTVEKVIVR